MMTEKRGWDGGRTRMDGSRSAEGDLRWVYEKRLCINNSYLLDLVRFSWMRRMSAEVDGKFFKIIWCRPWPPFGIT